MMFRYAALGFLGACLFWGSRLPGQAAPSAPSSPAVPPVQQPSGEPAQSAPESAPVVPSPSSQGTVLFQSHGEPPPPAAAPVDPNRKLLPVPASPPPHPSTEAAAGEANGPELTDRERGALLFTAYDLDTRIVPAIGTLTVRAVVTVRNRSDAPLARIALQISSALTWESVGVLGPGGTRPLALAQHLLDTDTDHTGKAREAVLELPVPLAPGASLTLGAFYSGTVAQNAERLLRIGANQAQGSAADWDAIGRAGVFLRGFGNVLWYPVSSPQLFLGDGARLFDAIDQTRAQGQAASVRLRLSVEYAGDPPAEAYFCGRRAAFTATSDAPDAPIAAGSGVATAEFAAEPLGFRTPSLFVVQRQEELAAPLAGEPTGGEPTLAVVTNDAAATAALTAATEHLLPLFQQWLGARPLSALTVLDHSGQPFEDGPLLVAPAPSLTTSDAAPALTFSLAHAWIQTGRPWVDDGLAQFFALLDVEQERGRDAMLAQLGEVLQPLTAKDGAPSSGDSSDSVHSNDSKESTEPLIDARSEVFYRRKAAAVWVMLREIVGAQALQITLQAWRLRGPSHGATPVSAEQDALLLESLLEKNSGRDLHRFFDDWVLHDRGLPDLTLAEVSPRALPLTESGRSGGWLTTVTVNNAGAAMADVPVIVSSGSFSTTVRLTVQGAGSATVRVQTESAPTAVQVNDGSIPEMRTGVHRRDVRNR